MTQRWRAADELRALEARQAELRQELSQLSASKRALLLRNALLSSWCEALSYIQLMQGMQQPEDMAFEAARGRLEQLLEKETQLLQQLSSTDGRLGCHVSLEQLLQPDSSTIAPSTDPMKYHKDWPCQAPSEATMLMDAHALAAVYKHTVQSASFWLHQLDTAAPRVREESTKKMTDIWIT
jgi:hypothetical protein